MLRLLNDRSLRQPVALESPIDRNGASCCVVGGAGARQSANDASYEAAEKGGCSYFLETMAKCAAHGTSPKEVGGAQPAGGGWLGGLSGRFGGRSPEKPISSF